jgi:hypothetical protein
MTGVVKVTKYSESPTFTPHVRLAVGVLVIAGAQELSEVTPAQLSGWANDIANAFKAAFNQNWSIVICKDWSSYSGVLTWSCSLELGGSGYFIMGGPYKRSEPASEWAGKLDEYFTSEFASQELPPDATAVKNAVNAKFTEHFGVGLLSILVARDAMVSGVIIGKSFSHSGHSIWIIIG